MNLALLWLWRKPAASYSSDLTPSRGKAKKKKETKAIQWRQNSLQQMVLEQVEIHRPKMNLYKGLIPFAKINSKYITDLTIKGRIVKLLEGK